jgi:hypothetical protein
VIAALAVILELIMSTRREEPVEPEPAESGT